jgi:hypothetical protein
MKVNIIGNGDGWKDAPHVGECWGITNLICKRQVNRVIDIHWQWDGKEEVSKRASELNAKYIDCNNYPLREIIDYFGVDYFSCSVDYALALAIYEGFTEIDMYGVNMAVDTEWAHEKPGVDFWCGVVKGRGIKLTIHGDESTVMKTWDGFMYGFAYPQKSHFLSKGMGY